MLTTAKRNFVLIGAGCLVMGGLAIGCHPSVAHKPLGVPFGGKGDSPVVLVGGSLIFRAHINPWLPVSATEYSVSPGSSVKTIVVKAKPAKDTENGGNTGDDNDATTDEIRVDVSQATTWQIDEYVGGAVVTTLSLNADGTIHLVQTGSGSLCPTDGKQKNKIEFKDAGCKTPASFAQVSISATYPAQQGPQTITLGNLACVDENLNQGNCRIVLRN